MSAVLGRRRQLFGIVTWALLAVVMTAPARADTLNVNVDQARLLKLPERVTTIIIGNPLIADATLQNGGILVVTGKGYGATNLLALDRNGRVIMRKSVRVLGPSGRDLVVVYKGVDRETYSCAPLCEPRITLGDSTAFFNTTLGQTGTRDSKAQSGASGGAAPAAR
jgi:Pilus formation protein N terminal region